MSVITVADYVYCERTVTYWSMVVLSLSMIILFWLLDDGSAAGKDSESQTDNNISINLIGHRG